MFIPSKNNAFTLVEVLIVFLVLGVLMILSVLVLPAQIMKARDAVRKGQLDNYKNAIETYFQDSGCYPRSVPSCGSPLVLGDLVIKDRLPCDPKSNSSYAYVTDLSECPGWFQIYTNLEVTSDKIIEKVGCSNGCGPVCQYNYGVTSANQSLDPFCTVYSEPPAVEQYVCAPGGGCELFEDPTISDCPNIYPNDPTCGGGEQCIPGNRCKNSKGKTIPD